MNGIMTWICIVMAMFFAAGIWFAYLVKVVLNDEVVQERRRRVLRQRELQRRKEDDKTHKRNKKRNLFA